MRRGFVYDGRMSIADWIKAALARSEDWRAELGRLRATAEPGARTYDLAVAHDLIEPDITLALSLYVDAWRAGVGQARDPALAVARELRAFVTVAEILAGDGTAEGFVGAAHAQMDAGLPERAVELFARGKAADRPEARACSERVTAEKLIDACLDKARGPQAAAAFLQAARIARVAKPERRAAVLRAAVRACPRDEELARMYDDVVLEGGVADDILARQRARLESSQGAEWVERMRTAASELLARNIHPGLALRMLRTSLEHAYQAKQPVRRHIAAWELLVVGARDSGAMVSLAPLLAQALRAPLPKLEALYVARLGLEVAWREARDELAAQPYVAALLDAVPGHPLASAFLAEAFPEPVDEPVMPTVTFKIPVMRPRRPSREMMREASPVVTEKETRADAVSRSPRKVVPVDVVIELPTGGFFSAVLRDLSASGAFVASKRPLEVGTTVALEIRLPSSTGLAQLDHRCDAKIVRRTDLGFGLQFVNASQELVDGISALVA